MWIENLYEPFEILIRERAVFPVDVHRHTFFELVYIVSGTGRLSAFGREVTYQPGDLFLIRPETAHRFVVETVSRFVCFCGLPNRRLPIAPACWPNRFFPHRKNRIRFNCMKTMPARYRDFSG